MGGFIVFSVVKPMVYYEAQVIQEGRRHRYSILKRAIDVLKVSRQQLDKSIHYIIYIIARAIKQDNIMIITKGEQQWPIRKKLKKPMTIWMKFSD